MKKNNKNPFDIAPIENYTAPKIPTLEDVKDNPSFLKKMPLRWKQSAAVITCVGLMGTWGLNSFPAAANPMADVKPPIVGLAVPASANTPAFFIDDALSILRSLVGLHALSDEQVKRFDFFDDGKITIHNALQILRYLVGLPNLAAPTVNPADGITYTIHHGGAGFANYIVHFTEQEALGILRMQLEKAGLNFENNNNGAKLPTYNAVGIRDLDRWQIGWYSGIWGDCCCDDAALEEWLEQWREEQRAQNPGVSVELFDSERNVAIAHLDFENSRQHRHSCPEGVTRDFERQSAESGSNLTFGVFSPRGTWVPHPEPGEWWVWPPPSPSAETKAAARPILEANIAAQVEAFVESLREQGIL